MPQKERLRVWRGDLRKTAGGLTKNHLMRNARGKIVSRKKSQASSKNNNLGEWLRSAGDSFGAKLQEKGLPQPKAKGQGKNQNQKPKAPRPQVDRKIKKPAAPKLKGAQKVVSKPKPKPKPKPKALPKPAPRKPKSPVKAGQLKNYSKISVGNILKSQPGSKVNKTGWPSWAKKVTNRHAIKAIQEVIEEDGDDLDWDDVKMEMEMRFGI